MESERKKFERWAEKEGYNISGDDEMFFDYLTRNAYLGWQARAALQPPCPHTHGILTLLGNEQKK